MQGKLTRAEMKNVVAGLNKAPGNDAGCGSGCSGSCTTNGSGYSGTCSTNSRTARCNCVAVF